MSSDSKKGGFVARTLINAAALYMTAHVVKGVQVTGFGAAIVAAIVIGVVNALIKPILVILSLPVNILTLGLFTFVINGLLLMLASALTAGFAISGIGSAILASILMSIISMIISAVLL